MSALVVSVGCAAAIGAGGLAAPANAAVTATTSNLASSSAPRDENSVLKVNWADPEVRNRLPIPINVYCDGEFVNTVAPGGYAYVSQANKTRKTIEVFAANAPYPLLIAAFSNPGRCQLDLRYEGRNCDVTVPVAGRNVTKDSGWAVKGRTPASITWETGRITSFADEGGHITNDDRLEVGGGVDLPAGGAKVRVLNDSGVPINFDGAWVQPKTTSEPRLIRPTVDQVSQLAVDIGPKLDGRKFFLAQSAPGQPVSIGLLGGAGERIYWGDIRDRIGDANEVCAGNDSDNNLRYTVYRSWDEPGPSGCAVITIRLTDQG